MYRYVSAALAMSAMSVMSVVTAAAEPLSVSPQRQAQYGNRPTAPGYVYQQSDYAPTPPERVGPVRYANTESQPNLGGGFIEFLFNGGTAAPPRPPANVMARGEPAGMQPEIDVDQTRQIDPKFQKQMVEYSGSEPPGTVIIDTPQRFLFLVQENGRAMRYGIGVGRPGFTWSGVKSITAKREWPDWTPPAEMIARRPDLPRHMEGGPENPLGARAMYLGSTLYRIHGSSEPWTIGTNVSSGCIRMRNHDVIDLYGRVNVGARVVVI